MTGIERLPLPAIARDITDAFFILGAVRDGEALIQAPGKPPETLTFEALAARGTGRVKNAQFAGSNGGADHWATSPP